ncbi:MAG: hypothetical protein RL199_70 [Pseudomonadota bacterium]|jgi:hypothetical protein
MSETEKTEIAPATEQQVHPEVARVQAIVAQAAQALTQVQSLLYDLPKVIGGNIALASELEKLKLDVVKDVQS